MRAPWTTMSKGRVVLSLRSHHSPFSHQTVPTFRETSRSGCPPALSWARRSRQLRPRPIVTGAAPEHSARGSRPGIEISRRLFVSGPVSAMHRL